MTTRSANFLLVLPFLIAALAMTAAPGHGQVPVMDRHAHPSIAQLLSRDYLDRQGRPRPDLLRQGIAAIRRLPVSGGLRRPHTAGILAPPSAGNQWNQIGPQPLIIDTPPPDIN